MDACGCGHVPRPIVAVESVGVSLQNCVYLKIATMTSSGRAKIGAYALRRRLSCASSCSSASVRLSMSWTGEDGGNGMTEDRNLQLEGPPRRHRDRPDLAGCLSRPSHTFHDYAPELATCTTRNEAVSLLVRQRW
jgi:hypothetical protein